MFNHLPKELKEQILNLIAAEDVPKAFLVSSEWRRIVMERSRERYIQNYLNMYAEFDIDSIKSHKRTHLISIVIVAGFAYWFKDLSLPLFTLILSLVSAVNIHNIMFEKKYFAREAQQRYDFFKTLQNESAIVVATQNDMYRP